MTIDRNTNVRLDPAKNTRDSGLSASIGEILDLAEVSENGNGLSEPLILEEIVTSNFLLAEVIGASINEVGAEGTPGSATVTGTTGTGTKFQAIVTIEAGGTVESVDSISVVGAYTVPPIDFTSEPVTGGGLSGASLALNMHFTPSVVGSDPTRGLNFSETGNPGFVVETAEDARISAELSPTGGPNGVAGWLIRSNRENFGVTLLPVGNNPSYSNIEAYSFGPDGFIDNIYHAGGTPNAPVPTEGDTLFYIQEISLSDAAEEFSPAVRTQVYKGANPGNVDRAVFYSISTRTAASIQERLIIDDVGNINFDNCAIRLAKSFTVVGLPNAPTLGMMAVVGDAITPTIGETVADGGSAKALVWYNGTAWTVMGV